MRIELFGKTALVRGVVVERTPAGLHVMINCQERWPVVRRTGGSYLFTAANQDELMHHDCFEVLENVEDETDIDHADRGFCHIVLVAETPEEREELHGLPFSNTEKDQVVFLYVARTQLMPTQTVVEQVGFAVHA